MYKWIRKMSYVYYSHKQHNAVQSNKESAVICNHMERLGLYSINEISNTQKDKCCIIPQIFGIQK
jgi:hypothetical protein